jgi:hypothetical protein
MYLGNPSLPISVDANAAKELATSVLKKRNWKDVSINSVKVVYTPYYLFDYVSYSEKETQGQDIVSGVEKGRLVLNPETTELVEEGISSINEREFSNEIPDGTEFELRKASLGGKSAEKVCQLKTAEKLARPIEKVLVENARLFYIPIWEIKAQIDEQEIELHIGAVNQGVLDEEKIPTREKTDSELVKEALNELKDPKAWVRYSREILGMASTRKRGRGSSELLDSLREKPLRIITIVLIIILIIVILLP